MPYNPDKHHRRSLRLPHYDYTSPGAYFITICVHQRQCLFGEIVNGAMQLNEFGEVARSHWLRLPQHRVHVRLDAFVIMPNHMHGIIVLDTSTDPIIGTHVGAGLAQTSSNPTNNNAPKPAPTAHPQNNDVGLDRHGLNADETRSPGCDGVGFGRHGLNMDETRSPKPTPPGKLGGGKRHDIPEIVRGYKTFSARRINRLRRIRGVPVWQRNYWERIIRDETALRNIRRYIRNNPASWQLDKLHPDESSRR
ncbi:MAG: transposase [Leptolyngbyaceae cyanobacterium]